MRQATESAAARRPVDAVAQDATHAMTTGIVHHAGEGESLFEGRIVLKSSLAELSVTESWFVEARPGADPHLHRAHTDSFYVLEGELAFLLHDAEHVVGPGAFIHAPPGVVHGFRSLSPARFLNFHTPDGRFADHLRELDRGGPGGFDSVAAAPGSGLVPTDAILLHRGGGERLYGTNRVATIKVGRGELSLIEFEIETGFVGPDLHTHDDHTDSFYVLEGEVLFRMGDATVVGRAGSFVAAPPGVPHAFSGGTVGARLLNVHAPGVGFHERLREMSRPSSTGAETQSAGSRA